MYNSLQISAHREGEQGRLISSSGVCRLLLPWLGLGLSDSASGSLGSWKRRSRLTGSCLKRKAPVQGQTWSQAHIYLNLC